MRTIVPELSHKNSMFSTGINRLGDENVGAQAGIERG